MLPFCGYNMGDYFAHWLEHGRAHRRGVSCPAIYGVNWFRKGDDGAFLWPGFGENSRVLEWICRRLDGDAAGADTAIGVVPTARRPDARRPRRRRRRRRRRARGRRPTTWKRELPGIREYFAEFGDRHAAAAACEQLDALETRLG